MLIGDELIKERWMPSGCKYNREEHTFYVSRKLWEPQVACRLHLLGKFGVNGFGRSPRVYRCLDYEKEKYGLYWVISMGHHS
jgi:hypothetical protein